MRVTTGRATDDRIGFDGLRAVVGAGDGIVGRFPGLAEDQRFEGRDLAIATDTRDLLADVLAGTLGLGDAELAALFPGRARRPLGLLRA